MVIVSEISARDGYDYSFEPSTKDSFSSFEQKIISIRNEKLIDAVIYHRPNIHQRLFKLFSLANHDFLNPPLVSAAFSGDLKWMSELLQSGTKDKPDASGITALMTAANQGNVEMLRLLKGHCDLEHRTAKGLSALHYAASRGEVPAMLELQSWGLDLNEQTKDGNTPLHIIVASGYGFLLPRLAQKGGDLTIRNHAGKLPDEIRPFTFPFRAAGLIVAIIVVAASRILLRN